MAKSPEEIRSLAARAAQKKARGEKLTRAEESAFNVAKREAESRKLNELLRAVPKKLYCDLAGRQTKVVNEQGDLYGLPIRGDFVDMFAFVKGVHDFFSKNSRKLVQLLAAEDVDFESTDLPATDWLDECRRQKALTLKIERRELEGQLLRRDVVHAMLAQLASVMQQAGEQLQRQGNNEGFDVLHDCLAAFEKQVEASLAKLPELSDEPDPEAA